MTLPIPDGYQRDIYGIPYRVGEKPAYNYNQNSTKYLGQGLDSATVVSTNNQKK